MGGSLHRGLGWGSRWYQGLSSLLWFRAESCRMGDALVFLQTPKEPGAGLEGHQPGWRGRRSCMAGFCSHISSRAWFNLGSLCQQRRDVTQSVGS